MLLFNRSHSSSSCANINGTCAAAAPVLPALMTFCCFLLLLLPIVKQTNGTTINKEIPLATDGSAAAIANGNSNQNAEKNIKSMIKNRAVTAFPATSIIHTENDAKTAINVDDDKPTNYVHIRMDPPLHAWYALTQKAERPSHGISFYAVYLQCAAQEKKVVWRPPHTESQGALAALNKKLLNKNYPADLYPNHSAKWNECYGNVCTFRVRQNDGKDGQQRQQQHHKCPDRKYHIWVFENDVNDRSGHSRFLNKIWNVKIEDGGTYRAEIQRLPHYTY